MPTSSPADSEPAVTAQSEDDPQMWRQSSCDLRLGLDVIEIAQNGQESPAHKPPDIEPPLA